MSYENEKALPPGSLHDSLPEDSIPKLDGEIEQELEAEEDAHIGVKAVRESVWPPFQVVPFHWTTYNYLAFATSAFDKHSLISTIQVAQSVIIACGKPVIAKFADVTSRATAYLIVLCFYVLGHIVIASANGVGALAVGIILYAVTITEVNEESSRKKTVFENVGLCLEGRDVFKDDGTKELYL
ncbi:hypothetical protein DICSQDRAFT_127056 [Dichomitus squalens LYAD-421 SS1]|uniref:Uncharacterized protein n=2 Tax=Dichomitus squalens TaxID=114155 RepID=A0A4Q9PJP3_9APHY|nr:uncharacterized protein DICSQDRAFT_127056 [Dichomitus squalens LYAD-421 SS1]EJF61668.1 hypothetical protein DICSQDRAFT_127056 [Dichomitus squalens LYAD-421 SS1]TBU54306.1 hypothetical protein BD310DRAFT_828354 [Dichomitus squalens]